MHAIRDGNGPKVTAIFAQVYDCPMLFALLKMVNGQAGELVPTESARERQSQQCPVPLALHPLLARSQPERLALLGGQAVARLTPNFLTPLTRRIPAARSALRARSLRPRMPAGERPPAED